MATATEKLTIHASRSSYSGPSFGPRTHIQRGGRTLYCGHDLVMARHIWDKEGGDATEFADAAAEALRMHYQSC